MKTPRRTRNSTQDALNFFAEAGLLKRVKRSGWWVAGIDEPESVADHSFRTAVIGYYLAFCEGADPFKVVTMCLFNDIHEARINDLHKMGHFYIDFKQAEEKVFQDQMRRLDQKVTAHLQSLRAEYTEQHSQASLLARDADILECLIQAKEYVDHGYLEAKRFFQKAPQHLQTASAKKMWAALRKWESGQWWQNVVKFQR